MLPTIFNEARNELREIMNAGAHTLKPAGQSLMPIKREMLHTLGDDQAALVLEACELLFAAILTYEAAQWAAKSSRDAFELVAARIEAGKAEGIVHALFYGPTNRLLWEAMDNAPIAFYALAQASPTLKIIDRLTAK